MNVDRIDGGLFTRDESEAGFAFRMMTARF